MEHRYDPTSINHESVLMGQIPDDVDDVHNGLEDLFGSTAPTPNPTINLGDNNVAAEGEALPDATASTAASTGRERKCTSNVWEDMDKIFTTENGVRVRVGARCHFCKKELAARSTIGTGHLSLLFGLVIVKNEHDSMAELGTNLCLDIMLMVLFFVGNIVIKLHVFNYVV
jgi:hypothetical protein